MAELSEELIGKLVAMAESFQDVKQQVQQASQDSQQSVQAAKSIAQEITALKGSLSSDLVSRFVSKDDIDQGDDEQRRADQALGFGGRVYKHNVFDMSKAMDSIKQGEDTRLHEKNLQAQTLAAAQAGIDAYRGLLTGMTNFVNAKWQQELRHADIATENQWEDPNEIAGNALSGEIAKSVQVPPAATEYKPS